MKLIFSETKKPGCSYSILKWTVDPGESEYGASLYGKIEIKPEIYVTYESLFYDYLDKPGKEVGSDFKDIFNSDLEDILRIDLNIESIIEPTDIIIIKVYEDEYGIIPEISDTITKKLSDMLKRSMLSYERREEINILL